MRNTVACLGLLLIAACEPPPEILPGDQVAGEPAVRFAFPPQQNEEGTGPFEVARVSDTGDIDFTVVIDTDNFAMVDPYADENSEPVDGQGHWHVIFNGVETPIPGVPFADLHVDAGDVADGQLVTITAALKQNDHSPALDSDGNELEATVEIKLVGS